MGRTFEILEPRLCQAVLLGFDAPNRLNSIIQEEPANLSESCGLYLSVRPNGQLWVGCSVEYGTHNVADNLAVTVISRYGEENYLDLVGNTLKSNISVLLNNPQLGATFRICGYEGGTLDGNLTVRTGKPQSTDQSQRVIFAQTATINGSLDVDLSGGGSTNPDYSADAVATEGGFVHVRGNVQSRFGKL